MVKKGEIAYYKQFLLFSQCFPELYIFSASKCGIVWYWVKLFTWMIRFLSHQYNNHLNMTL